jgi:cobalamin biosynthetic protein CobC
MSDKTPQPPLPLHGGDLSFATSVYGMPRDGWLDLSTGINPHPYPAPLIPPEWLHRLPDNEALLGLLAAARKAYRVPDAVDLIAVPGTEAAIRQLPGIMPPGEVAIVGPTYGTYATVWPVAVGIDTIAEAPADAATIVAVSPNNPDGRIVAKDALPRGPFLVIDEAFADLTPDASVIPTLGGRNALVLRSLGKFYGLAGLRLGFVAAAQEVCAAIAAKFGAWPVSGPAIAIGTAALADTAWRERMRAQLATEAAELRGTLATHELKVTGGTDLFVLADADDAHSLHGRLARHGVWTRAFAEQPRWLRFGLPGASNLARLAEALSAAR